MYKTARNRLKAGKENMLKKRQCHKILLLYQTIFCGPITSNFNYFEFSPSYFNSKLTPSGPNDTKEVNLEKFSYKNSFGVFSVQYSPADGWNKSVRLSL